MLMQYLLLHSFSDFGDRKKRIKHYFLVCKPALCMCKSCTFKSVACIKILHLTALKALLFELDNNVFRTSSPVSLSRTSSNISHNEYGLK